MKFFEILGSSLFRKKNPLFLFAALTLPFVIAFQLLAMKYFSLRELEELFDAASLKGKSALEKRLNKKNFLQRYGHYEPYFLNRHVESLPLLQNESEQLTLQSGHPACSHRAEIKKRIAFLSGKDNHLAFAEETTEFSGSGKIKETEEKLIHPVEINSEDLLRLLSLLEGVEIGSYKPRPKSPQTILKEFTLTRKEPATYECNLSLLKREFTIP